jgi:hypothetical protein
VTYKKNNRIKNRLVIKDSKRVANLLKRFLLCNISYQGWQPCKKKRPVSQAYPAPFPTAAI